MLRQIALLNFRESDIANRLQLSFGFTAKKI